ncbi:MAG TPA: response regulator transcription factor [Gammaproteobacteria bacterium]|nr:response regulator transcription factor [Gammaproteobacteria bacterium]
MQNVKILIVEDHQLFIEGLRIILGDLVSAPEILCANTAARALEILGQDPAIKLILMDIGLPDIDGRALLKILRSQGYRQPLLVVSGSENVQIAKDMMESGAQGYVLKSGSLLELRKAMQTVINGGQYIPQGWQDLFAAPDEGGPKAMAKYLHITERQLDVLYLLAKGHPNKAIADWLGVTEHTVKTHIQALFDALGVRNRTSCVREAERLGLLTKL